MDSNFKDKIYRDDDGENRIFFHICFKLTIVRYYNNHLESQTHKKFPYRTTS